MKDVVASTVSHRRIVTAAWNPQDRLEVQTWDFDAQGKVSLHASAQAGEISRLGVTTLAAARVITSVRDAAGNLKLIVWDAIDDLVRLGDAQAGAVGLLSIVPLGSDWIATPVETAASTLKVIAWREQAVSLLHGEWGPSAPKISKTIEIFLSKRAKSSAQLPSAEQDDPPKSRFQAPEPPGPEPPGEGSGDGGTSSQSPIWSKRFYPGVEGADPMIAVGFEYIIVTQQTAIGFFDKEGTQLTKLSTDEFFSTFFEGQRSDGSRNEHSIQRHTAFPPKGALDEYPPGASVHCDPDAPPVAPCIDNFFDTRVHFDPTSRRFFILAEARPLKLVHKTSGAACGKESPTCVNVSKRDNPLMRRYFAFAVSKTEDPRDGFYQWMTTDAHKFDWPLLTVNQGVMVMATNVDTQMLRVSPIGMKPLVYVFSVEDLLQGKPYPRSHKFFPPEFFPSYAQEDVLPLVHYGDTAGRTFFVHAKDETINVFSFKNPTDWRSFPGIDKTSKSIKVPVAFDVATSGAFRGGKIYLTWMKRHVKKKLYSIRLVRLPLTSLTTKPSASTSASDGFLYDNFGTNAPEDDPGDVVSYEIPAIAVNKDGHMVIVYARVGYDTKKPLFPEARYSVFYADDNRPRRSRLLRWGESMQIPPWDQLDYQTAVVDPSNDETIWVISEFADKNGYRTVVGKVKP